MTTQKPPAHKVDKTAEVEAKLSEMKYPLIDEISAVRKIIKGVNPRITEEWKWNAPSFSYGDYMVTLNLSEKKQIRLVFHCPEVIKIKSELLMGEYRDRRLVYMIDMADIVKKKNELERIVREIVEMRE